MPCPRLAIIYSIFSPVFIIIGATLLYIPNENGKEIFYFILTFVLLNREFSSNFIKFLPDRVFNAVTELRVL